MNSEARYLIRLAAFAVVILLLFCTLSPTGFLSTANLSSMAYQLPEFAMLALAIHPTMLTGGIDLSGGCVQWALGSERASCDFGHAGNHAIFRWSRGRASLFNG